jgi:hypothetical protein
MSDPATEGRASAQTGRQRVVLALALFSLTVGVVVVAGSLGGEPNDETTPAECVQAWNRDEVALGTGAHGAGLHGYTRAWVLHLDEDAQPDPESGRCAVVFAAPRPDPEIQFGATILVGGRWQPLSERPGISPEVVGQLQRAGLENSNATLLPDGSLAQP